MSDGIQCWCCTDCIMLFANGEMPEDRNDVQAWLDSISHYTQGCNVVVGGKHDADCPNLTNAGVWIGDSDCSCEDKEFSWSDCETCGSTLGGSRHAVTLFPSS